MSTDVIAVESSFEYFVVKNPPDYVPPEPQPIVVNTISKIAPALNTITLSVGGD